MAAVGLVVVAVAVVAVAGEALEVGVEVVGVDLVVVEAGLAAAEVAAVALEEGEEGALGVAEGVDATECGGQANRCRYRSNVKMPWR